MIVVSLLAASALITSARASPTSDWLLLYDLYNQRSLENRDSPMRSANDVDRSYPMDLYLRDDVADVDDVRDPNISREKKLGLGRNSLSIVNPVDVLRQRVLLELARRQAMQDQRQVDANRRMLASVGKRSVHQEIRNPDYPRNSVSARNPNNRIYSNEIKTDNQQQAHRPYTQRIPIERSSEWYNDDDSSIRGSSTGSSSSSSSVGDDETRKVLFDYHHDRV